MGSYNVVFEGAISDEYQIADVKRNLAALFKIDETKADVIFAKPTVILKKGVDYASAQKYREAILKTGAICNVKEVVAPSTPSPTEQAAPPNPTTQALQQNIPLTGSESPGTQAIEKTPDIDLLASDEQSSKSESTNWLAEILGGVALIGVGFTFGGSIFLGNPGPLDYFFDCLGIFWILRGFYKMLFVR